MRGCRSRPRSRRPSSPCDGVAPSRDRSRRCRARAPCRTPTSQAYRARRRLSDRTAAGPASVQTARWIRSMKADASEHYSRSVADERPAVWVGHVAMTVGDPTRSHDFFVDAGMRTVHRADDMAILELRGGTHLLLFRGDASGGDAPFDRLLEAADALHAEMTNSGLAVSDITRGRIHDVFMLTDPDGHEITVQNSHVEGVV